MILVNRKTLIGLISVDERQEIDFIKKMSPNLLPTCRAPVCYPEHLWEIYLLLAQKRVYVSCMLGSEPLRRILSNQNEFSN
jgi:hypothetical protein